MPVFAPRSLVSLLAGDVSTTITPSPPSAFGVGTSNVRDLNNLFAAFSDNENMCSGL